MLWLADSSRPWWLALSNIFALYLFAPLPALLLATIYLRSAPLRLGCGLMLTLFLAQFGAQLIPPAPTDYHGQSLRVATFNLLGTNRNDIAVAAEIRARDADLVALQELTWPMARALDRALAEEYPYRYFLPTPGHYGLGLLSRFPLIEHEPSNRIAVQRAVVDVNGAHITVLNIHLPSPRIGYRFLRTRIPIVDDYDPIDRERAAPRLLQTIASIEGPLIALGDFNTAEREPLYNRLAEQMRDAYRATNWGFGMTFPNLGRGRAAGLVFPVVRIDYIWTRDGIEPATTTVNCRQIGSDHCMLIGDLRIASPAAADLGWKTDTHD